MDAATTPSPVVRARPPRPGSAAGPDGDRQRRDAAAPALTAPDLSAPEQPGAGPRPIRVLSSAKLLELIRASVEEALAHQAVSLGGEERERILDHARRRFARVARLHAETDGTIRRLEAELAAARERLAAAERQRDELAARCARTAEVADEPGAPAHEAGALRDELVALQAAVREAGESVHAALGGLRAAVDDLDERWHAPDPELAALREDLAESLRRVEARPVRLDPGELSVLGARLDELARCLATPDPSLAELRRHLAERDAAPLDAVRRTLEALSEQVAALCAEVRSRSGADTSLHHVLRDVRNTLAVLEQRDRKADPALHHALRDIRGTLATLEERASAGTSLGEGLGRIERALGGLAAPREADDATRRALEDVRRTLDERLADVQRALGSPRLAEGAGAGRVPGGGLEGNFREVRTSRRRSDAGLDARLAALRAAATSPLAAPAPRPVWPLQGAGA